MRGGDDVGEVVQVPKTRRHYRLRRNQASRQRQRRGRVVGPHGSECGANKDTAKRGCRDGKERKKMMKREKKRESGELQEKMAFTIFVQGRLVIGVVRSELNGVVRVNLYRVALLAGLAEPLVVYERPRGRSQVSHVNLYEKKKTKKKKKAKGSVAVDKRR